MGYAKLFSSITESSLWSEPKDVRLLFVTMLARADATGYIEASVPGLARIANLSLAETQAALAALEGPDSHSKDLSERPELEGRRIVKVPGGWTLVNYEVYRNRRSEEERREYMRSYMEKYRAEKRSKRNGKQKVNKTVYDVSTPLTKKLTVSQQVSACKPELAQAEAEAEAEAEKKERETHAPEVSVPSLKEILFQAQKIGLPDWKAREFFDWHEATGWKRGQTRITKFAPLLAQWRARWEAEGRPTPENALAGHPNAKAGHSRADLNSPIQQDIRLDDGKYLSEAENQKRNEEAKKK